MIDFQTLSAILIFCFTASVTPGPNNLMLLSSGLNYGIYKTLPQMLGISIGFGLLCLVTGIGIGSIIKAYPPIFMVLKIFGGLYLVWLAYKIAITKSVTENNLHKPFGFIETFIFQWVNPKAWIISLSAFSVFSSKTHPIQTAILITFCFIIVNIPAMFIWAGLGKITQKILNNSKGFRAFNIIMALLLLLSIIPMVKD